ncbi:MAG: C4-dicarboxylate ABC transporter substrate-binding protein [Rhodospirillaceae bacterium TMED8]|nr:C4-dicarboxylate ABC transporter substrate-binding protein [Magnetovibrio sp.]OUT52331.1 MAG: C4-dicarboxylate ABC transporter substrate-binding protein [Rhodospirillaceae bacterium TMED8]|tara:strand:- start:90 stop:1070 length:981 start_codon:yes stop_codon:yes gene_type:complete
MTNKRLVSGAIVLLGFAVTATPTYAFKKQFISIGTGSVSGVYYPTGRAICGLVNNTRESHGIRCSVEVTSGSTFNINKVRAGELEMGIAQSDWQYHAYNGTGKESFRRAGPFKNLRAVFSVYPEPVSIVTRADSGIKIVDDLAGKRVSIGEPGSRSEAIWTVMWRAMGKTDSDLTIAARMKSLETPAALCDNKIDAFFWLAANPATLNREAAMICDVKFASVDNALIAKLVSSRSFYRWATIPGGMYRGNPEDIKTFGVGATLVTSTRTSINAVYNVVKAVFDNFEEFKKKHPTFSVLSEREMMRDGLSAPLHLGAIKFYKERGWM